jgi:hypothetical protein
VFRPDIVDPVFGCFWMEGEVKSHNSDLIIALVLGNNGSGESGRWFPKFRGIGPESVDT